MQPQTEQRQSANFKADFFADFLNLHCLPLIVSIPSVISFQPVYFLLGCYPPTDPIISPYRYSVNLYLTFIFIYFSVYPKPPDNKGFIKGYLFLFILSRYYSAGPNMFRRCLGLYFSPSALAASRSLYIVALAALPSRYHRITQPRK